MRTKALRGVGATVAVALAAGCSGSDGAGGPGTATPTPWSSVAPLTVDGMDLTPQLDEVTGAVVVPLDRFETTDEERAVLTSAGSVALALCARERGVDFVAPPPGTDPVYLSEHFYGPWTVAQAERFAFVEPMSDADLAANGVPGAGGVHGLENRPPHPNTLLTEEDREVVEGCAASGAGDRFTEAHQLTGPWTDGIRAAQMALMRQDETAALFDELGACFTTRGMAQDPEVPWSVVGAGSDGISEQQVQLALAVVSCKEEIGFTPRMADLYARATLPVVAEHADELVARRATTDEALAEARELIAAHADVLWDWP